nr:ER membrane protein complex subunit 1 [Onthophagus taurus]
MAKMAIIESIARVLVILIAISKITVSLYEDQIDKFDWKQSYVGKIKFAHFDSVKRIIVGTEENVIAALNLKNGQIFWRNVLEDTNQIEFLHVDKEVISVSGNQNTYYVRGWDLNSGVLLWEWVLHPEKDNGRWFIHGRNLIHVVAVLNSHVEVSEYDVQSGKNKGVSSRLSTPWINDLKRCGLAETYFVCLSSDDSNGQIYYIDLTPGEEAHVISKPLTNLIGNAPGKVTIKEFKYTEPAILLIRNNVARLVILKQSDTVVLPNSFSPDAIIINNNDQIQFMDLSTNDSSNLRIKTMELAGQDNVIDVEYLNSLGKPKALTGICRGNACRMLFTTTTDVVGLLQLPTGKILWTREESLSKISGVEFVELPVSDLDASIEKEFTPSNDVIAMLYNRLLSQTRQLSSLLSGQQLKSNKLIRDEFGLHKLIIIATNVGKLFALDSLSGEIIWSVTLPDIEPFKIFDKESIILLEQRNARYAPLTAEYILVARNIKTGKGVLYNFDPITGEPKDGLKNLDYKIKQIMLLPYEDESHLKGLLILSDEDKPYLYPENMQQILYQTHLSSTYMYTINSITGILNGFNFVHSTKMNLKATPTWKLTFKPSEIVAVSVRPAIERVHSQGRVLADRSVLYKYVNPNLIALATLTEDPIHKHVLSVYLIDGVTGLIIYSINHKRAKEPIHLVHSENWVVYSYFNEKFRRMEMGSLELYEGARQSNSTAFSSHALSQLPHVETLSCILPAYPLAMVATLTERGITNKHLLIALANGGVNEMPWMFLEPRGQHILSSPDEGSVPYMPELPLVTEATINYNQSLARIKGINVSPARLESTTLVFVHGLDLFYTRVMPSKTFDMLKEDFDHWLIVMVLVGLIVSSYVTKQLALRKALRQAWK